MRLLLPATDQRVPIKQNSVLLGPRGHVLHSEKCVLLIANAISIYLHAH